MDQKPADINPSITPQKKKNSLIVIVVLAVLVGILLISTAVFATRAFINDDDLNASYNKGVEDGSAQQKAEDEKFYAQEAASDTRVYTAPVDYGAFEITLPKFYSLWVDPGGSGQIAGNANPFTVDASSDIQAFSFDQTNQSFENVKRSYDNLARNDRDPLQVSEVTVSGIKGFKYVGRIDREIDKVGTVIVLPVRDKTFVLKTSDNDQYGQVFNQIVEQIKITP